MSTPILELEGTWEEVSAHASELAGQRVRLTVLKPSPQSPQETNSFRPASGRPLLSNVGTWVGDDLQQCLEEVVNSRGLVEYDTEE